MTRILPFLDEWNGGHLLWSETYPGLALRGESRKAALAKLPGELRRYCRWLDVPVPTDLTLTWEEHPSALSIQDADSDAILPSELRPLTTAEYAAGRDLALRSAGDFLALYRSIPEKDALLRPRRKTFYGPIPATAEEMYQHTKNVNAYYFGEIGVEVGNDPDILACRRRGFSLLERQPDFLQNPAFDGSYGETWTLRKLLRRFLWHDRIHARALYLRAAGRFGPDTVADPFFFGGSDLSS